MLVVSDFSFVALAFDLLQIMSTLSEIGSAGMSLDCDLDTMLTVVHS